ncbi:MAG: hypothetical protein IPL93_12490 [Actinomycetales bacterium]|nr:hypothetical protein [Actinomycetales bacterium]
MSAGDGSPTTLSYSHVWNVGTAGTCQTFDNTATSRPAAQTAPPSRPAAAPTSP